MKRCCVKYLKILLPVLLMLIPAATVRAQYSYDQSMRFGYMNLHYRNYDLAQHFFNNALKARPESATPYVYLALSKYELDDYAGAECDADSALRRNNYLQLGHLLRGASRIVQDKDSLGLEDMDFMLRHDPYQTDAMRFRAFALLKLDRNQEAIDQVTDLIRVVPDSPDFYAIRARAYLAAEDTVAALADIDAAIKISPVHINAHLMRCDILCQRKQWEEAAKDMDEIIEQNPYDSRLYLNRAVIQYSNDNYYKAMQDLDQAISLQPDMPEALFNRALLYYEIKDYKKAAKDITAVLELQPDNFKALLNRTLIYMEDGRYREALADMQKIVQRYPRFYQVYYLMADAYLQLNNYKAYYENVAKADDMVRKYVDNPDKYTLDRPAIAAGEVNNDDDEDMSEMTEEQVIERYNKLVTATASESVKIDLVDNEYQRIQDQNLAVVPEPRLVITPVCDMLARPGYFKSLDDLNVSLRSHIPVSIAASPNEPIHLPYPHLYFISQMYDSSVDAEEYTAAIGLLERYMQTDNSNELKIYRAALNISEGNWHMAFADLDLVLDKNADSTIALLLRAEARLRQFEQAYTKVPEDEIDRMMYDKEKQDVYTSAIADFDRVISIDPTASGVCYNKGCLYFGLGDTQSAIESFNKAIEQQPEMGAAYYNRALSYLRIGNSTDAMADLRKAGSLGMLRAYNVLKKF